MAQVHNTTPSTLLLYGETENDLNSMPTTTTVGTGKYQELGLAPAGTVAQILSNDKLTYYMLRSTGWVKVDNLKII